MEDKVPSGLFVVVPVCWCVFLCTGDPADCWHTPFLAPFAQLAFVLPFCLGRMIMCKALITDLLFLGGTNDDAVIKLGLMVLLKVVSKFL